MVTRKTFSIALFMTLLIFVSLFIAAYVFLGRATVLTNGVHQPSGAQASGDSARPAKNSSAENTSQLEADCIQLSEREGVDYIVKTGMLLISDIYPPDGMDCVDRERKKRIACFDNQRVGIIRLAPRKTATEADAQEFVGYTKPVPHKDFDRAFFSALAERKRLVSFCGRPVEHFSFVPKEKQRDIPKYEIKSIEYIDTTPRFKGD
jgi:hypothetical protein